jgi:hypothetical protein
MADHSSDGQGTQRLLYDPYAVPITRLSRAASTTGRMTFSSLLISRTRPIWVSRRWAAGSAIAAFLPGKPRSHVIHAPAKLNWYPITRLSDTKGCQ